MTTISVVFGTARAHVETGANVGLSTLERDALDGRPEIHVVLDDAESKLTAIERPPTARKEKEMARWLNPMNRLRRGDARVHAEAGTCCDYRRTARNSSGGGPRDRSVEALRIRRSPRADCGGWRRPN